MQRSFRFFYKEQVRTHRLFHFFIRNGKECKNVAFFWKERMPNPAFFYVQKVPKKNIKEWLLHSFKWKNATFFYILLRSFFEFLATYETQKECCILFRSFQKNGKECKECYILFKRMEKNVKNVALFSKERKRM